MEMNPNLFRSKKIRQHFVDELHFVTRSKSGPIIVPLRCELNRYPFSWVTRRAVLISPQLGGEL